MPLLQDVTLGIDFGTSNSAMAVRQGAGLSRMVALEGDAPTLPTALFFNAEDQRTHFGRDAVAQYLAGTEGRLMRSLKSLLGSALLQDKTAVSRAPGVGPKVAVRIVTELRNKAPAFAGEASASIGLKQEIGEGVAAAPVADAVSALTNLGYSRDQAANAVAAALKNGGEGADSAKLIRLGLKELSR